MNARRARRRRRWCAGWWTTTSSWRFELAPALELIEGERAALEEALVNLAVAAGDTLPAGGRVRIATASQ